jgi:hypothetical protein
MGNTAKHTGPLSGVCVIDLTTMVMGPYCTQIMADMGADVIKIEPPGGDNTRYMSVGPAPGMSGIFVNVNRGKRSIVLDLRAETDKATLRDLLRNANVLIHSMRSKAIVELASATRTSPISTGDHLHKLLRLRPARARPRPHRLRRHHPGGMRPANGPADADRPSELCRHDHGGQDRRHDRALRHNDGAVPPRTHWRGPGGRGQHVRLECGFISGRHLAGTSSPSMHQIHELLRLINARRPFPVQGCARSAPN